MKSGRHRDLLAEEVPIWQPLNELDLETAPAVDDDTIEEFVLSDVPNDPEEATRTTAPCM
jgi:hypothetical protein